MYGVLPFLVTEGRDGPHGSETSDSDMTRTGKDMNRDILRRSAGLALSAGLLMSASGMAAEDEVDQAIETGVRRTEQAQEAQQQIDRLSGDIEQRVEAYRSVEKEIEGLEVYVAQLRRQIADQESELGKLERSIENVTLVERQITPLMLKMVDALEQFVELDVPFLLEERRERLAELQSLIGRADVTVAEKFRKVMEAYQSEMEFGQTIEAYRGSLALSGEPQEVEFLRLGRVALLYRSLDGEDVGVWDQEDGAWESLGASYRGEVERGLRIAREQAAPDLIRLPLPVAQAASTEAGG